MRQSSFKSDTLEMQMWPDRSTWQAYLATAASGNCIVLGADAEVIEAFYTVTLYLDSSLQNRAIIAVCSEGHGLNPALWLHPDGKHLLLGFNSQVACIYLPQIELQAVYELECLFYRFFWLPQAQRLLVQHEIGLVAFSTTISEVWRYSGDVITDMRADDATVRLSLMDAPPVCLSLDDGSVIID